jgi:hypothetical protein
VVGRAFSSAAIELALASYPGFNVTAPPADASPYGKFTAAYVPADQIDHVTVLPDGTQVAITAASEFRDVASVAEPDLPAAPDPGSTRKLPLGTIVGARSGDKGGSANVGVWVRSDEAWPWLVHTLTVDRFRDLLPETAELVVTRHVLANLRALNFVVEGILGDGVSSQARFDPQAKALGEWLRSRHVDIPVELL